MVSVGLLLVSLLFVGAGLVQLVWPQIIASHKQRWDAIRNRHQGVERDSQDWVVTYTRRGGVLLFGVGLFLLLLSVNDL